jgi:hypothetical protein
MACKRKKTEDEDISSESDFMISFATGNSTIELSNEVGIDYCSSDDEIDFDLGSSDEDGEDSDDEANNDENSDDTTIVSIFLCSIKMLK